MAKKKISLLLGLSVASGLLGTYLFQKKNSLNNKKNSEKLQQHYAGDWWFINRQKKIQHHLTVNPSLELTIDDTPVLAELIQLDDKQLVLRDKFGYHLIIQCNDNGPESFYDEADDATYPLTPR